jgi:hypothetical protein
MEKQDVAFHIKISKLNILKTAFQFIKNLFLCQNFLKPLQYEEVPSY